jgi:beta-lactamase superfamily II metal-dependent hydrolase
MNSYVIKTITGKIIVIDGGFEEDAAYLKGFLAANGNNVDAWFVSHQHGDHIEALTAILKSSGDLKINKIYGSMLDLEWIKAHGPDSFKTASDFNDALKNSQKEVVELKIGEIIKIDGVSIEVLGIKNPEIFENPINNSSIVIRVWDAQKSILFPGDLGIEGGQKLLNSQYCNHLKSDYIQMAHHGQNGVDENFYKAVSPKYCIWPTPLWLWDNDSGQGKNSGSWKTPEVLSWMNKLNVQKHYRLFDGLVMIR